MLGYLQARLNRKYTNKTQVFESTVHNMLQQRGMIVGDSGSMREFHPKIINEVHEGFKLCFRAGVFNKNRGVQNVTN